MGSNNRQLPQFFKVFQPHYSSQSLLIPPAFADRINGGLPNRVVLKNGVGKIWLVDIANIEDDGLYFKGGWSKFVSENSLRLGDFLVFKYNGQRIFDVLILGINGCEKELVATKDDEQQPQGHQQSLTQARINSNSDSKGSY